MKSMKVTAIVSLFIILCAVLALSGCTSPTPAATPTPGPGTTPAPTAAPPKAVLTVNGTVNAILSYSLNDVKGHTQYSAGWQNNAGSSSYNGTGPRVTDLLNLAGLPAQAKSIKFVASDGYNVTMTLADLNSKYSDSIVAWDWSGVDKSGNPKTNKDNTLQLIVPASGSKDQVSNLHWIIVS